jgi:hypothetical protein
MGLEHQTQAFLHFETKRPGRAPEGGNRFLDIEKYVIEN